MTITPHLASLEAAYDKLGRELYRAFHHQSPIHKADHFHNFCITAQSMRDFLLERLGKIQKPDTRPFRDRWEGEPLLVAVADIANTAKHFQLRKGGSRAPRNSRIRAVKPGRSTNVSVYRSLSGEYYIKKHRAPTYFVTLESGAKHELYAFMDSVAKYWENELKSHGISIRRQNFRRLSGGTT